MDVVVPEQLAVSLAWISTVPPDGYTVEPIAQSACAVCGAMASAVSVETNAVSLIRALPVMRLALPLALAVSGTGTH